MMADLPARVEAAVPEAAGRAVPAAPSGGLRRKVLLFRTVGEWFGLPLDRVREVCSRAAITRVPRAPAQVLGMMNLRGRPVVLLDLPRCLDLPGGGGDADHVILFDLGDPDLTVGILADGVDQVVEVEVRGSEGSSGPGGDVAGEGSELVEAKGHVATLLDPVRVMAVALPGVVGGGAGESG